MRASYHKRFDFGFVFSYDESNKANDTGASFSNPQLIGSDSFEMPIKVVFRVFSANGWVIIDFTMPFSQLPPQAAAFLQVLAFVIADNQRFQGNSIK